MTADRTTPRHDGTLQARRSREYGFTAGLGEDLDRIAGGRMARKAMLGGFWKGFQRVLEAMVALERATVVAAVEGPIEDFAYGSGDHADGARG